MSTDKTLADVQPGGRVRLGDQAPRVFSAGRWTYDGTGQSFSHEEMDAAAFVVYRDAALSAQPADLAFDAKPRRDVANEIRGLEASVAVGSDGEWVSIRRSVRDSVITALRNISSDFAHVYAAYAAKCSAQPSPGGQGDSRSEKAATFLRQYLTYLRSSPRQGLRPRWCDVYEAIEVAIEALAARQPVDEVSVKKEDANNYCLILRALGMEEEGDPVAEVQALIEARDRQPVGEPVARLIEAVEGECDGLVISMETAAAILAHVSPAAYTPAAYMVDGRIEQGLFFDRAAAETMAAMNAGEVVPLFRSPAQAVDLEQFRQPVQDWLDDAQASMEEHGDYDGVFAKDIAEANRLLALIDSQAVGK
ncbi:hypothetical protein PQS91_10370 [Stenotrophomonas geniculata]|uniref:hypothetical protein n=1 Tax=Stenotrophomonas geniculata TaxID=86188 RepID=UPI00234E8875|nr:hypothetical protein [Stenotrophomonas geniculata]MDC7800251.1 hypothetical protein [Stenotrophomonas geniculata]